MSFFKVIMIADIDVSRRAGDTIRTLALSKEIAENGGQVTLIVPLPNNCAPVIDLGAVKLVYVPVKQKGKSILNILFRRYNLAKAFRLHYNEGSIVLIETSVLAGYLCLFGVSNYVLDVHGIAYDEVNFASLPWYAPKVVYKKYIYFLENLAVKRAVKVISVSETMAEFINKEWHIPKNKIELVPNGYFPQQIEDITKNGNNERKNIATFVGVLAKWAYIEKIIRVAALLENDDITIYIVGGATNHYCEELKELTRSYNIDNLVFTGSLPLQETYKIIADSEIVLFPFPKSICTEVACPIKVIEYMALGKAIVLDEVSDISRYLKINDAALVCTNDSENEFAEHILLLHNDNKLADTLGKKARELSKGFSWKDQGIKLKEILLSTVNTVK